ncbi:MAG: cytochrome c-type biogenesis protein [Candidatus Polarisedimenticolia bacterium]
MPRDAFAADATPRQQIEGRLMCYCGCADLTVRTCTCGTAESIRREIDARLASGATPDQVVAGYVERYGEKILSAPTKEGFNLLAWTMPFAVLLAAALCIVVLVRRWGRAVPAAARTGPDAAAAPPVSDRLMERVRREIERDR